MGDPGEIGMGRGEYPSGLKLIPLRITVISFPSACFLDKDWASVILRESLGLIRQLFW